MKHWRILGPEVHDIFAAFSDPLRLAASLLDLDTVCFILSITRLPTITRLLAQSPLLRRRRHEELMTGKFFHLFSQYGRAFTLLVSYHWLHGFSPKPSPCLPRFH